MTAPKKDLVNDPELYARMSVPFETVEEANAAFKAFFAAVRKLREKHRIREVSVIAMGAWKTGEGSEQDAITNAYNGSVRNQVDMLAWGLGKAQRDANERLALIVATAIDGKP